MDVFEAFPNAIVSGIWQIAAYQRGGVIGSVFDSENAVELDVIEDEASSTDIAFAPNSEPLDADYLLYVRPAQLPTTNVNTLVSGYLLYKSDEDEYYAIVDAGRGKNQETGELEHLELMVKQTEVVNG